MKVLYLLYCSLDLMADASQKNFNAITKNSSIAYCDSITVFTVTVSIYQLSALVSNLMPISPKPSDKK